MGIELAVAIGGLVVSGVSAYQQHEASKDAADAARQQAAAQASVAAEQRKQAELAQRQADIQNARTLRAAARQARIARAAVINTGANVGTLGSSGVVGGAGSITTQNAANTGYFGQMQEINTQVTASQKEVAGYTAAAGKAAGDQQVAEAEAGQWGALGGLGGTIFQGAGGFKTIFSA